MVPINVFKKKMLSMPFCSSALHHIHILYCIYCMFTYGNLPGSITLSSISIRYCLQTEIQNQVI